MFGAEPVGLEGAPIEQPVPETWKSAATTEVSASEAVRSKTRFELEAKFATGAIKRLGGPLSIIKTVVEESEVGPTRLWESETELAARKS